jgi:DNA-binding response OmpR family regulator
MSMISKRILVVSEDSALMMALCFEFESRGSTVRFCGIKTAEAEAMEWQPQLVIIDGALPGKDSLKICRNFKRFYQLCNIPVIVLAPLMNIKVMSAAYKAGADYYVLNQGEDRRALMLTVQAVFNIHAQQATAA